MTIQEIEKYFTSQNIVTPWAALDKVFDVLVSFPENQDKLTLAYSMDVPEDNYAGNTPGKALGVYMSYMARTLDTVTITSRHTKVADGLWVPQFETQEHNAELLDQLLDLTEISRIKFLGASITTDTRVWLETYVSFMEGLTKPQTHEV